MSTGQIHIILDGQFGSCGKGAYAQWLANDRTPHVAVRTGGPNAGHTIRTPHGVYSLRHIPAAVASQTPHLVIPAGALIDPDVLWKEIDMLQEAGFTIHGRLIIDPMAAVVTSEDKDLEKGIGTGTTGEGIGAATSRKLMRSATLAGEDKRLKHWCQQGYTGKIIRGLLRQGHEVHVEMTQGWGLSLDSGYYPYCTSRNITPAQAMADCGFYGRGCTVDVHLLYRPYPIRIAGNSGPLKGEMSWEELSNRTGGYVKPEYTTVTKKQRRIGVWDDDLAHRAACACEPTTGVLTFADYLYPEIGREVEESIKSGTWDNFRPHVEEMMTSEFLGGAFDTSRAPFQAIGSDLHTLSVGFGAIVQLGVREEVPA